MFLKTIALAAGALTWSAAEYAIHRFVGHGPMRRKKPGQGFSLTPAGLATEFNTEHVAHHTNPQYFAPSSHKAAAAIAVGVGITTVGSVLVGPGLASAYAAGFSTTYLGYEFFHRRIHTKAPRSALELALYKHHLLHHHGSPKKNHGVTSVAWDKLIGTHNPADLIKVPRKVAPPWMVAADSSLKAEYEGHFQLVGKPGKAPWPKGKKRPEAAAGAEETQPSNPAVAAA